MILPSFVVVGAPRCGTTSLHYYLRQHPQVCMSTIKEPNFFLFGADGAALVAEPAIIRKSVRKLADYAALFRPTSATAAVGEASPLYLYAEMAASRILAVCGAIRIVCLLRRPAERAWSHFVYAFPDVAPGERRTVFAEMVDAEMRAGPGYEPYRTATHLVRLGRYADQVRRYQDTFGADNVLAMLSDDLAGDRAGSLARIAGFVGVDDSFAFDTDRTYNTSVALAGSNRGVAGLVRRATPSIKRLLPPRLAGRLAEARMTWAGASSSPGPPPAIDPAVDRRITEWCADDVAELATLIGRDLSAWTP